MKNSRRNFIKHSVITTAAISSFPYILRAGKSPNEKIVVGLRESGEEVADDAKSHGTKVLVTEVQSSRLVFSDVDHEGISQLERISKQKLSTGKDRYFVLSDRGSGADSNDHIYASYICFGIAIDRGLVKPAQATRKLPTVSGVYT